MNKKLYRSTSHRLEGYDYTQEGAYFVTICTENKGSVLGEVRDEQFHGSEFSNIIKDCWHDLPNHYKNCVLDEFVIMPDHIHGIIIILNESGFDKRYGLPEIVRAFKSFSAQKINAMSNSVGKKFWQKNYYDRIIRSPEEMDKVREYIADNPFKWHFEKNENIKL